MLVHLKGNIFEQPDWWHKVPTIYDICRVSGDVYLITLQYTWDDDKSRLDQWSTTGTADPCSLAYVKTRQMSDFVKVVGSVDDWYWIRSQKLVSKPVNDICNDTARNHDGFSKYVELLKPEDYM
jgi:hypothetical protein